MNTAQSPHIPAIGQKPGWKDLPWMVRYSARGLLELMRARLIFAKLEAKSIRARNRMAKDRAVRSQSSAPGVIERIGYVLPRLSDRLPWRSDCLVQAIAGQNWLATMGLASEIQIGVELPDGGKFGAHAWLKHGETVVTGGEIERYHLLLADSCNDEVMLSSNLADIDDR